MSKIAEFNAAADAHTRRMVIAMAASVAGMFAVFGVIVLIRETALESLNAHLGEVGTEIALLLLICLALGVFLTGMWLGYRRGNRDPLLNCTHCNKMLVENRKIVVATRNCVHCGKRVLAEPE